MEKNNNIDELDVEELEIEAYAISHPDRKPKAKTYIIRIDKTVFRVHQPEMTGLELLTLAGKVPVADYRLRQKFRNGEMQTVELDARVDFRAPGVERFVTLKLENTEG
jgi:hypothetical protein